MFNTIGMTRGPVLGEGVIIADRWRPPPSKPPNVPQIPGTGSPGTTGTDVPRRADTGGGDQPRDECEDAESELQKLLQEYHAAVGGSNPEKAGETDRRMYELLRTCNLGGGLPGGTAGGGPGAFGGS
jgi:hypothetical protein